MLRLVARHADAWNAAWYGPRQSAAELEQRIAHLREACAAEGRDPAEITLTVGLFASFPALQQPEDEDPPDNAIAGDAEEVGRALAEYRELGIEHLIVHLWPPNAAAVRELGRAAEVARADARIAAHG
jgi:alkanesulfonate monooxygenase SsuD/methylene tetrahydromethanopterin reductase-like flavin-dependent oxidoreductase (luciferase family)